MKEVLMNPPGKTAGGAAAERWSLGTMAFSEAHGQHVLHARCVNLSHPGLRLDPRVLCSRLPFFFYLYHFGRLIVVYC